MNTATHSNFISVAWEKEEKLFFNNLSTIRHQPAKDAVHDIRVNLKKLKAYLLLNEEITGLAFTQNFKGLKRFFSVAGKYRDTQMAISMLKKHATKKEKFHEAFEDNLDSFLPLAGKWTKQAAIDLDIGDISRLRIIMHEGTGKLEDPQLREGLRKAAENKLLQVRQLSAAFREQAHEIRKLLKIVYYWLLILPPPSPLSAAEMKNLEGLLDTLGKWQDHMVLVARTRRFRKDWLVKHTREQEQAKSFEKKIRDDADELLSVAEKQIKPIRVHFFA